jgi:peptide-methionine (S)-S-oxide reductase
MKPNQTTLTDRSGRRALGMAAVAVAAMFAGLHFTRGLAAESAVKVPAPSADLVTDAKGPQDSVVFAGGCFWGVQGVFQHTKGVLNAVSGYAGGRKETASYETVSGGDTGHAEAVQITFDPKQISYAQLLQIYFSVVADPTQLNRQGPDRGTQYRSAVFTNDASQKMVTEKYIAQLEAAKVFPARIVTQISPLNGFYAAEAYHQDYATLHPESGYIATFDLPKIAALKSMYPQWYRDQPILVMGKRA